MTLKSTMLEKTAGKLKAAARTTGDASGGRSKRCVLVVDDDSLVRDSVVLVLESLGFCTYEASNGLEALRIFDERRESIDLVLMDLDMPVMDGVNAICRMRKIDPRMKVVIASALVGELASNHSELANDTISKPFSVAALVAVIDSVLMASPAR